MGTFTLDFGSGFDVTESPADEFNIALDFTEVTVNPATLIIPTAAAPTPTTEGDAQWDSNDDKLVIGDGAAQKIIVPTASFSGDATVDTAGAVTVAATHSGSAHHTRAHAMDGASDHSAGALGDVPYGGVAGAWTLLTGNITTTKKFLTQTGDGAASAAPGWNTVAAADLPAATTSAQGAVELAITSEIDTGTDSSRAMPIDQFVASTRNVRYVLWRVVGDTTDCAAGTTKGGDLEFPFTGTITEIGAYVDTAGTTNTMTVDVNIGGTTIMTTNKITIDSTEKSSRTAATAPALTTTAIAAGDILTVDIDGVHTTAAKGLTVRIGVRMT